MENLLVEGRYDKVTSELSNEIVQAIKSGKKTLKTRIRLFTRTFVDINIYFKYTDDEGAQIYGATYLQPKQLRQHFKNKRIVLHVIAPKDPRNRVLELNSFIPEIKNIVRHEVEHILQFYIKDRERNGFFSSKRGYPEHLEYWEYMTEPYEVEAYNRGLYKKAKTLRQPLNVLFDKWWEYLDSIELNPDEINVIKKAWTDYAKKHLYQSPTRQYGYRDENTMGAGIQRDVVEPVTTIDESLLFEAKKDTLKSKWSAVPDESFNKIVDGDPSSTKKYADWMLKIHVDGGYAIDDIIPVIQKFDQVNGRINIDFVMRGIKAFQNDIGMVIPNEDVNSLVKAPKDINTYKGLAILRSVLNQVDAKKTKREEKIIGADKIFEDENFLVVLPKTAEGSCHYGAGTQWCTAAKNSNQFDNYSRRGTLYYIIFKAKSVLDKERISKPVWQKRLPQYEKVARYIPNGLEYGAQGEFYNTQDARVDEDTILNGLFGVTWKTLDISKDTVSNIPNGTQPFYDSFNKASIAIDTHYANNGMKKEHSDEDDYDDEDFGDEDDYVDFDED